MNALRQVIAQYTAIAWLPCSVWSAAPLNR